MTVDRVQAQAMRDEGQTLQAIGDRFGVSRERIRQVVEPPGRVTDCADCGTPLPHGSHSNRRYCNKNCQQRAYQRRHPVTCACGRRKSPPSARCVVCKRKDFAEERARRFDQLAALWSEGLTMKQIAERLGTTTNALGGLLVRARTAGWDLPFRRARSPKSGNLSKSECRFQFAAALHKGTIRRATRCEACGATEAVDGHHHDYNRPLYVEWLCGACHMRAHGKQPIEAAA